MPLQISAICSVLQRLTPVIHQQAFPLPKHWKLLGILVWIWPVSCPIIIKGHGGKMCACLVGLGMMWNNGE